MTPWAVFHEMHDFAAAITAASLIIGLDPIGLLRNKTRPVTPRTIMPLRQHPLMAAMAEMAVLCTIIKPVSFTAAPRAALHGL